MLRKAAALFLTLMAAWAFTQAPPTGAQTQTRPVEPEYRLQKEDVLRIQLLDREEADVNALVTVGRDGRITPPFLDTMVAEGLTVKELRAQLLDLYRNVLRVTNPQLSLTLERVRDMRAAITGAVARPGQYPIRPGDTILSLLAQGGDTLPETRANIRRATLTRGGSREAIPLDLSALRRGDMSQNYELLDGDILNVPEETGLNRIIVWGKVRQPGPVPFVEGMTVADAIAAAGGEIPNQSRFSKTTVIREAPDQTGQPLRIEVNMVAYFRQGDFRQNIKLQRRDIVFVPDSGNPNFEQLNQILGVLFVLERFGINVFRT